jgi:hypothetical protein
MKSWVNRILVALLIAVMTGVVAFAKSKKETVTFPTNLKVNGTLVKKGTYDVSFDEQTAELSILRNGKPIAKAQARVEKRERKAKSLEIRSSGSGDDTQLLALTFGGSDQSIVVNQSGGQTTGNK